jgi:hypothetical protein
MILRSFYNGALSIASKHDFDDQFFFLLATVHTYKIVFVPQISKLKLLSTTSRTYCTIYYFCSTLSEFENFLLCERILINVTTCQNETSS